MSAPRPEHPLDGLADLSKTIITVSTGLLALAIAFRKDIIGELPADTAWTASMFYAACASCLLATIASLVTAGKVVHLQFERPDKDDRRYNAPILCINASFIMLGFATVLMAAFGWLSRPVHRERKPLLEVLPIAATALAETARPKTGWELRAASFDHSAGAWEIDYSLPKKKAADSDRTARVRIDAMSGLITDLALR